MKKLKHLIDRRAGASIMEMLFVIAIVALIMPFAFRRISEVGGDLGNLATAKRIIADMRAARSLLKTHTDEEFEDGVATELEDDDEENQKIYDRVYALKTADRRTGYAVMEKWRDDVLTAHKIADMIGIDAAVCGGNGEAGNTAGGWAVELPDLAEGDLVYRITLPKSGDGAEKYLHRTLLDEDGLAAMERDLSMGGFAINQVARAEAGKLTALALDAYLVSAPVIAANNLYFPGGLNLNPGESRIPAIRATGDAIGFRNFTAVEFSGPGGSMTADRASVSEALTVANRFEVKSLSGRTVTGFAGAILGGVRTSYLDTDTLQFAPGFGITVSGELLYSGSAPIKLGSWSFPSSAAGPKFNRLRLKNFGGEITSRVPDFSDLMKANWRAR